MIVEICATPQNGGECLDILRRCAAREGEARYSIAWENCEHYATGCFRGRTGASAQVQTVAHAVVQLGWHLLKPKADRHESSLVADLVVEAGKKLVK